MFQVTLPVLVSRLRSKPAYFSFLLIQLSLTQNLLPCDRLQGDFSCLLENCSSCFFCSNKELCITEHLSDTSERSTAAFHLHLCCFSTDGCLEKSCYSKAVMQMLSIYPSTIYGQKYVGTQTLHPWQLSTLETLDFGTCLQGFAAI